MQQHCYHSSDTRGNNLATRQAMIARNRRKATAEDTLARRYETETIATGRVPQSNYKRNSALATSNGILTRNRRKATAEDTSALGYGTEDIAKGREREPKAMEFHTLLLPTQYIQGIATR